MAGKGDRVDSERDKCDGTGIRFAFRTISPGSFQSPQAVPRGIEKIELVAASMGQRACNKMMSPRQPLERGHGEVETSHDFEDERRHPAPEALIFVARDCQRLGIARVLVQDLRADKPTRARAVWQSVSGIRHRQADGPAARSCGAIRAFFFVPCLFVSSRVHRDSIAPLLSVGPFPMMLVET